MKLITEKGIEFLEQKFGLMCMGERSNLILTFMATSVSDYNDGETIITDQGIIHSSNPLQKQIVIQQKNLETFYPEFFNEERVWLIKSGTIAVLTSTMDHQRLSNTFGLLDLFLKAGTISKKEADNYLEHLTNSIVPELQERFKGEILEYKPYYDWEYKLIKQVAELKKSV